MHSPNTPEADVEDQRVLKALSELEVKPLAVKDPTTGKDVSSLRVLLTGADALRVLAAPEDKRAEIATAILKARAASAAGKVRSEEAMAQRRKARKAERRLTSKAKREEPTMRTIGDERPEPAAGEPYEVQSVEREEELAILVVMHEDGDMRWIPKSVIHSTSAVREVGDCGSLVLQAWWLEAHSDQWGGTPSSSKRPQGTGKAIGVSDLAQVQRLLEKSKGVHMVVFGKGHVEVRAEAGTFTGKDLTEAVRTLDRARRE